MYLQRIELASHLSVIGLNGHAPFSSRTCSSLPGGLVVILILALFVCPFIQSSPIQFFHTINCKASLISQPWSCFTLLTNSGKTFLASQISRSPSSCPLPLDINPTIDPLTSQNIMSTTSVFSFLIKISLGANNKIINNPKNTYFSNSSSLTGNGDLDRVA